MINGERCTRACGFCHVDTRLPASLDPTEPDRVAAAVSKMRLDHVVITAVARDDLADGGAAAFAHTIKAIASCSPATTVEVLIPDFNGDWDALELVLDAGPEVLNHNVETVPRLYRRARYGSDFERSKELLRRAGLARPGRIRRTKSGCMVGLGETREELLELFAHLRESDVDVLTVGQYLRPAPGQLPIERYYSPEEFDGLRQAALTLGFRHVESGPLVRSSYHAKQHVEGASAPATPGSFRGPVSG